MKMVGIYHYKTEIELFYTVLELLRLLNMQAVSILSSSKRRKKKRKRKDK